MEFNILSISAANRDRLRSRARLFLDFIKDSPHPARDICFTANRMDPGLPERMSMVAKSGEDFVKKLTRFTNGDEQAECYTANGGPPTAKETAFLFSGQGSQYTGMAKELYECQPLFKEHLDRMDRLFSRYIGRSIIELLYSGAVDEATLGQAIYAQPAIFSVQYALFRLWRSWGVQPSVLMGHSIGEYSAAAAAEVFTPEQAAAVVAARARVMHNVPAGGGMIGVLINREKARRIIRECGLEDQLSIAAVNAADNITLSGASKAIETVIPKIKELKIFVEPLNISHPFHSVLMEPYVEKFKEALRGLTFSPPKIPIISTINGQYVDREMCEADYWTSHIRRTVNFHQAVLTAASRGVSTFVEIGGAAVLSGLAGESVHTPGALFLPSLRKGNNAIRQIFNSLSQLHVNGVPIDWDRFYQPFEPGRIQLPDTLLMENDMDPQTETHTPATKRETDVNGIESIQNRLTHMVQLISGLEAEEIDPQAGFFSLGVDSLMLINLRKKIAQTYGVDITINDFFTRYTNLAKIASHVDQHAPHTPPSHETAAGPSVVQSGKPASDPVPLNPGHPLYDALQNPDALHAEPGVARLIEKQLEIMTRQQQKMTDIMEKQLMILNRSSASTGPPESRSGQPGPSRSNPYLRVFRSEPDDFTPLQRAFVQDFIQRYNEKTGGSKAYARDNRAVMTDWINSLNFRISLKDLIYPIVTNRSQGSRIWDIDGNRYIDLAGGFGANYFGHKPPFVIEALKKRIDQGFELATQSDQAGEVARMIADMTGTERVVFSNTGTEAVMAAVRIARAATGRNKIVRFAGSYHGTFDGILAEADEQGTFPIAPGTTPAMVSDVEVLTFGSPESLEKIEAMGGQLAGVLVEPVQSRRPGFQPRGFLHKLRDITSRTGAAFIMDDVYMGFRIHQGGCQAHFGVKADIVTYGKIIGGGMPIGVIAGKARFMDTIDGGYWNYGDDSYPSASTTFFAGTFCRHPLAMAAAHASLTYMQEQGPALQENVNKKTLRMVDTLNRFFEEEDVPMRLKNFGSLFRFESFGDYDLAFLPVELDLFFHLLISKGVYVWERRVSCLTVAHDDEDVNVIIRVVKEAIRELRQGGFSFSTAVPRQPPIETEPKRFPLTPAQKRYYVLNQITGLEKASHLAMAMVIDGQLDFEKMAAALRRLDQRHEALRISFQMKDGEIYQHIHSTAPVTISRPAVPEGDIDKALEAFLQPFDLTAPPLVRIGIAQLSASRYLMMVDSHHIISDGDSANILIQDIIQLYEGNELPPMEAGYSQCISWWNDYFDSSTARQHEEYWLKKFSGRLPQLDLPGDFPRPARKDFKGGLVKFRLEQEVTRALKRLARDSDASLFMLMLAIYFHLLHKLSGQKDIIVGIPVSTRGRGEFQQVVGFFTNNLVLRARPEPEKTFGRLLEEIKNDWLQAFLHKEYPFEMLLEKANVKTNLSRNPLFDAMFIYENVNQRVLKTGNLQCELYYFDSGISTYDFTLEVSESGDLLDIKLFYSTQLFEHGTIEEWAGHFRQLTGEILDRDDPGGFPLEQALTDVTIRRKQLGGVETPGADGPAPAQHQDPTDEIETCLEEIWRKELNLPRVSIHDDFFQLGGRSFDTIRTMSRINRQLGVSFSLTTIFQYPTIAGLAALVRENKPDEAAAKIPPITPAPHREAYPLSHGQSRYWVNAFLAAKDTPKSRGIEITGELVVLDGDFDFHRLRRALDKVVQRHDILRTRYADREGKPVQIIDPEVSVPLEFLDFSSGGGEGQNKALKAFLEEQYHSLFDLTTGPLIRFHVLKTRPNRYILLCNAPHISFDGWSFAIVLEELIHYYNAPQAGKDGKKGEDTALPAPAMRYVDYVEWHNRAVSSGAFSRQADYWSDYLGKGIPVARLPYDYPEDGPPGQPEPAAAYRCQLNSQLSARVFERAANENTTPFVIILAAMNTWIANLSNQGVVTVGTIFSGRTQPELERIPGIMMTLLPVRLDLNGNPDCKQVLDRTKEAVKETYRNQDFPLELVAHKMRKTINMNRDIYSIMCIGQEALEGGPSFNGSTLSTAPLVNFTGDQGEDRQEGFIGCDYNLQQDMLIEMFEEKDHITLLVRYNNHRFKTATIQKYFDHLKFVTGRFLDPENPHLSQLGTAQLDDLDDLF